MGLQQVKDEILVEAEEKSVEIKKEAENYREEKLEEAEKKAEQIRKEAEKEVEEQKSDIKKKKTSNARMEAKTKVLETKRDKIRETFESFEEEIRDLSDDQASSMLENAIEETEFEVGKIIGSEEFEEPADEQDLEFEEQDLQGFKVVSENGERRRDYSFNKIFKEFRENYRKQVADKLF